jgi:hypothetical protein
MGHFNRIEPSSQVTPIRQALAEKGRMCPWCHLLSNGGSKCLMVGFLWNLSILIPRIHIYFVFSESRYANMGMRFLDPHHPLALESHVRYGSLFLKYSFV